MSSDNKHDCGLNCPIQGQEDIPAKIAVMEERISDIKEDVGELKRHVLGNGKAGLNTRTDRLEQAARIQLEKNKYTKWFVGAVIVAAIGSLLSTGGTLLFLLLGL